MVVDSGRSSQTGLMQQAQKSRIDALSGKLRCLSCGRVCPSYTILAQHLKDKHDGINSSDLREEAPASAGHSNGGFSLGELLARKLEAASARPASSPSTGGAPGHRHRDTQPLVAPGPQDIRALLKEFKSRAHFSAAMKGHLRASKKKMSRLKRIIVRERADKAVAVATQAAAQAAAAAAAAKQAHSDLVRDTQDGAQSLSYPANGSAPRSLQTEVMKMAAAEAERRLVEADRLEEAAKATLETRLQEREKLYKVRATRASVSPPPPAGEASPAHSPSKVEAAPSLADNPGAASAARHTQPSLEPSDSSQATPIESVAAFGGALGAWLDSSANRVLGSVPELAEDEDSDEDLGPDGWDDVLSAWMGSAGLPDVWSNAAHAAMPARSSTPEAYTADGQTSAPLRGSAGRAPVGPAPAAARSGDKQPPAAAAAQPSWLRDVSSSDDEAKVEPNPSAANQPVPMLATQDSSSNSQRSVEQLLDALPSRHAGPPTAASPSIAGRPPVIVQPRLSHSSCLDEVSLFHNQLVGTPPDPRGLSAPATLGYDVRELLRQQVRQASSAREGPWWDHTSAVPAAPSLNASFGLQPNLLAQAPALQHRGSSLSILPHTHVSSHFEMPADLGLRAPSLPGPPYGHTATLNSQIASLNSHIAPLDGHMPSFESLRLDGSQQRLAWDASTLPADLSHIPQSWLHQASLLHHDATGLGHPSARRSSIAIGQLPSTGGPSFPGLLPTAGRSLDAGLHSPPGDVRAWLRHTSGAALNDTQGLLGATCDHGTAVDLGMQSLANGLRQHCNVCQVTCTATENFQQHLDSRKHQRNAATAAAAEVDLRQAAAAAAAAAQLAQPLSAQSSTANSPAPGLPQDSGSLAAPVEAGGATTYMGLQANSRTYCCQVITAELNQVVVELLQSLLYWQERARALNPAKAKQKKRLVSGLREVAKAVKSRRARVIIVAPNIEHIQTEGGLDDLLTSILSQAGELGVPVVFALSRKKLGQVFGCRKKMSAIAVLDFSSAEGMYNRMTSLAAAGREDWQQHRANGLEPPAPADEPLDQMPGSPSPASAVQPNSRCQAPAVHPW
ncbi:hypothetical protein WJX84_009351 [Apatococcus fuscideae]|uniref:C2H2-type domain-containing protein n=1 Tax=Apatococcus fuscideae TaxID=2026836 RepID=A0AAW1STA5_9CHLO